MKQIIKTVPPTEFVEYCKTDGVSFSTLSTDSKNALKKRLLEDQGFICCYCGCRITDDGSTKIEHIKCQKYYPELALCFDNMLASCDGGDKDRENKVKPPHHLHCDAKKSNDDIPISPLEKRIEGQLVYYDDGTVKGRGKEGKDLIQVLGLNAGYLVTQRKNVWDAYSEFKYEDLIKALEWIREKHEGKYEPYCFVQEQCIESYLCIYESETESNAEAVTV